MVECQLPKLKVASSILVARSICSQQILNVEFKSHTSVRSLSTQGHDFESPEMSASKDNTHTDFKNVGEMTLAADLKLCRRRRRSRPRRHEREQFTVISRTRARVRSNCI